LNGPAIKKAITGVDLSSVAPAPHHHDGKKYDQDRDCRAESLGVLGHQNPSSDRHSQATGNRKRRHPAPFDIPQCFGQKLNAADEMNYDDRRYRELRLKHRRRSRRYDEGGPKT
jgi:hypothetical protein